MKSTTNTIEVKQEIEAHFRDEFSQHSRPVANFEHDQWFVSCLDCGFTLSVHDVSEDEFEFEELNVGDESCDAVDYDLTNEEEIEEYSVIVGNIGTVCTTTDLEEAERVFKVYEEQSKSEVGRAGGENVTMFLGDEIHKEFFGSLSDTE